jgi:UPF0176 protein
MTLFCSAFYKFVEIADPAALRPSLLAACLNREIKGSILLAHEGINGTISGGAESLSDFFIWLRRDPRFAGLETKLSTATAHPFGRMKVRLKREIVAFGVPEADPARGAGIYVAPEDWNALIQSPDVTVIDTRNDYEVRTGTFKGAIDPKTRSFRQFPAFVRAHLDPARHKRVAAFCTGGIRCEKATSYLIQQGFEEVYHLEGGILKYLETVPEEESLWQGECFVFDGRVALQHGLRPGSHGMCRRCGTPVALTGGRQSDAAPPVSCENCSGAGAGPASL